MVLKLGVANNLQCVAQNKFLNFVINKTSLSITFQKIFLSHTLCSVFILYDIKLFESQTKLYASQNFFVAKSRGPKKVENHWDGIDTTNFVRLSNGYYEHPLRQTCSHARWLKIKHISHEGT